MISHRDAATWSAYQWATKVSRVQASGEGAVGVLFVWANDVAPVGGEYAIATASFVVKPLSGSAVSTRFAETVLTKVANTESPDSIELVKGSKGHDGVLILVNDEVQAGRMDAARARPYMSAGSFVLQKMMHGFREMSKDFKKVAGPDGLVRIINNHALMNSMGRLAAADMIIGNGDRIQAMNMGNIMFKEDGTIAAIDSASILASFEQLVKVNDVRESTLGMRNEGRDVYRRKYVEIMAFGGVSAPTDLQLEHMKTTGPGRIKVATAPSASMQDVSVAGLQNGSMFENMKTILLNKVKNRVGTAKELTAPNDTEWSEAKSHFQNGFTAGLAVIDTLLGGKAAYKRQFGNSKAWKSPEWRELKSEFKKGGQDGTDPNFSWHNLTIRREVYIALRNGEDIDTAIASGAKLAQVKEEKQKGFFGRNRVL